MAKKHDRSHDDDSQPCHDDLRPPRRVKQEQAQVDDLTEPAYRSTLALLNRPVEGLIYTDWLEAKTARFLVLHPGSTSDEIRCDLIRKEDFAQTYPDKTFSYEALSYVWGEEEHPDSIVLCGSRFAVTRNLAEALRYLRYTDYDRVLWVDAICINQCDKKEKEAQVLSMHWVYRSAKEVIAWLGPPDRASSRAFSEMTMMQRYGFSVVSAGGSFGIKNGEAVTEDDAFKVLMNRPY